ncbi:hypothetical protein JCM10908_001985 [Rhodotorula pacifica]|uniref:leucine-rich repeat domain-containing protein n=1 Tax=Rhodotorula pacifica TaxID=1495444 RepID=UPI00317601E4
MPKLPHKGHKPNHGEPYARQGDKSSRDPSSAERTPYTPRPRPGQAHEGQRGPRVPPKQANKSENKPPKTQQLDLSGQLLSQPPRLADYTALTKLNLSNCGLTSIGFVKEAARSLTWLNVTGNDLSGDGAWDGVETLSTLFVLNASHCKLTETPRCVASLKTLKALVLSHNSLTKLEHVANLPDLNTIVVSNNALTALPRSLATLPALKKISAAHNQLSPPGLPDLSALSHLHELRLNDNRPLSSLPSHFGSWGKAPLPTPVADSGYQTNKPRKGGLEILDLGNCGFESWFGLRELAKQDGIVNLGLKGNKVAQDAIEANGFDGFREKLTVLLPSLRILDTHRFDAKHAELKAARSSRTAEQKILDAGPMALALNAQSSAPVEVDELLRARERERENRRRRKKGIKEEVGEGKKRRREEREESGAAESEDAVGGSTVADSVDKGKKRVREAADTGADEEATDTPVAAAVASEADEQEQKPKKPKKRTKAERKALAKARSADEPSPPTDAGPTSVRSKGGALDALRGDDTPASTARAPAAPAPAPEEPRPEEIKQKTSVAKIIEVRKSDAAGKKKGKKSKAAAAAEADKVDVGTLLGIAPSTVGDGGAAPSGDVGTEAGLSAAATEGGSTTEKASHPFAALGAGAGTGSGLFGSGGWD